MIFAPKTPIAFKISENDLLDLFFKRTKFSLSTSSGCDFVTSLLRFFGTHGRSQ